MSLTVHEVRQVATLARLAVPPGQLAAMAEQLNRILGFVDQLAEVPTDGVEPLAHPLPLENVFRDDVPVPSLPVDEALRNAPKRDGDYFGVPAVFDLDDEVTA